jgi:hypothetical protein
MQATTAETSPSSVTRTALCEGRHPCADEYTDGGMNSVGVG